MQHDLFAVRRAVSCQSSPVPDPALDQWFTPPWAADVLVADALKGMGTLSVLEPAAGTGNILGAIPSCHEALGIEIDPRMAEEARRRTGRQVLEGDYRYIDLGDRRFGAIVGNPPFGAEDVDALVARSHQLLDEEGVLALILPAHLPASSERIEKWREKFSIEVQLLPRNLFPRLTLPLAWTKMIKCQRRTLVGLMLFTEQGDVSAMPDETRRALAKGATWCDVIADALASLGGTATLHEIYSAVEPRRRSPNPYWKDKTRQVLREYSTFKLVENKIWQLAA